MYSSILFGYSLNCHKLWKKKNKNKKSLLSSCLVVFYRPAAPPLNPASSSSGSLSGSSESASSLRWIQGMKQLFPRFSRWFYGCEGTEWLVILWSLALIGLFFLPGSHHNIHTDNLHCVLFGKGTSCMMPFKRACWLSIGLYGPWDCWTL